MATIDDLPPDEFDEPDDKTFVPATEFLSRQERGRFGGRPRNGYEGDVDKVHDALLGLFQAHKEYGEFELEIKRRNKDENAWKTCGFYKNLSIENMPNPDEIGRRFGDGRFMVVARYANKNGKKEIQSFQIDLDTEYAKYRQTAAEPAKGASTASSPIEAVKAVAELAQVAGVGSGANNGMINELVKSKDEQFKAMIEIMKPQNQQQFTPADAMAMATKLAEITKPAETLKAADILEIVGKMNNSGGGNNDFMQLFIAQQKAQSEAMQMMMQQQQQASAQTMQMFLGLITAMMGKPAQESFGEKMLVSIMPKLLEGKKSDDTFAVLDKVISLSHRLSPNKSDDDDGEATKIVEMILPYVPTLLKSTIDAIAVRSLLKAYPDYQALMSNPAMQEKVVGMLQDKLTPEQLSVVMQKTGIGADDENIINPAMPGLPAHEAGDESGADNGVVNL